MSQASFKKSRDLSVSAKIVPHGAAPQPRKHWRGGGRKRKIRSWGSGNRLQPPRGISGRGENSSDARKILALLAKNAGKVLTHDFIIKEIWGLYFSDSHTLRVNMANIGRKAEENPGKPKYILAEVGVGYRPARRRGSRALCNSPPPANPSDRNFFLQKQGSQP